MIPGELPQFNQIDPVETMVKRVKEAYILYRRAIHPNWTPSSRWDKCWLAAAKMLVETGWDPGTYMCVLFQQTVPFPQPNMIYNDAARRHMLRAIGEGMPAAETKTRITAEVGFWQTRLKVFGLETALEMASENPAISALFLFCAARQFGFDGSRWARGAVETLRMTPVADAYREAKILTPEIEADISSWITAQQHQK